MFSISVQEIMIDFAEMRKGASIIRKQIDERREASLLEQERKDQETKVILQAIKEQAEFEMEEKRKKYEEQKILMQKVPKYLRMRSITLRSLVFKCR